MTEEEKILVDQIKNGDTNAFDRLFRAYYQPLFRFISSLVNNSEAAEDLLQDIFLNVWKTRQRLDRMQSIKSYLFRSAKNISLNYLRHQKVIQRHIPSFGKENLAGFDKQNWKEKIETVSPSPEEVYIQNSLQGELQKAVQSLPERTRTAFYLSRYEELSHIQIAEIMEISPKTVNNHIVQALLQLRKLLQHLYQK
ncbi:MAG: RNA polymerase sigma-70 factor [Ignavibacteriaceae bacterium]|jgi:RNA polymerase sigma-70 factor (ECF subfamily)